MKVEQLVPAAEGRATRFSLKFRTLIPEDTGCYVLATFSRDVVYVGQAENLRRRFAEHRDAKDKRDPTSVGRAFWFYFLTCARKDLDRIERTWMNEHVELHGVRPALNRMDSPVRG